MAMKARHPGQVGAPEWWPWLAWPTTVLGLAAIVLGVVQVMSGDLLGWQAVLLGPVFLVLSWLNAFALGTTRPGRWRWPARRRAGWPDATATALVSCWRWRWLRWPWRSPWMVILGLPPIRHLAV
jgi:hypothetical protein